MELRFRPGVCLATLLWATLSCAAVAAPLASARIDYAFRLIDLNPGDPIAPAMSITPGGALARTSHIYKWMAPEELRASRQPFAELSSAGGTLGPGFAETVKFHEGHSPIWQEQGAAACFLCVVDLSPGTRLELYGTYDLHGAKFGRQIVSAALVRFYRSDDGGATEVDVARFHEILNLRRPGPPMASQEGSFLIALDHVAGMPWTPASLDLQVATLAIGAPEPATWAMWGGGLLGLGLIAQRRRRA